MERLRSDVILHKGTDKVMQGVVYGRVYAPVARFMIGVDCDGMNIYGWERWWLVECVHGVAVDLGLLGGASCLRRAAFVVICCRRC
jgi:hypothetical protein